MPPEIQKCALTIVSTLQRLRLPTFDSSGIFGQKGPQKNELRDSALIAEALSEELGSLPNGARLRWLHQITDCEGGKPDIILYVSSTRESCWYPAAVIEVGYLSSDKEAQAVAYGINSCLQHTSPLQCTLVGQLLLATHDMSKLTVKLNAIAQPTKHEAPKHWNAPVFQRSDALGDTKGLGHMLWAFVQCAEFTLKFMEPDRNLPAQFAKVDLEPGVAAEGVESVPEPTLAQLTKHVRLGPNACRVDDRVYKCFDYRYSKRTVDLTQRRSAVHYKDCLNSKTVVNMENLTVISYPWIEGSHVASNVGQFHALVVALQKLHESGLCHGDIRGSNVLFSENSMLIDPDFMGEAGKKRYPRNFNRDIPDGGRHTDASQDNCLQPAHDWFALGAIMNCHQCASTEWKEAIRKIQSPNLDVECTLQMLENLSASHGQLQPEKDYGNLFLSPQCCATGSPPRVYNQSSRSSHSGASKENLRKSSSRVSTS